MSVVIISTEQVTAAMRPLKEIEAEFGVVRSTLDNWVREGSLTKYKLGYAILFDAEEVAVRAAQRRAQGVRRAEGPLRGTPGRGGVA
ncbi:DNA-binding protein [Actinomyces oricola]|uniref:DNA-binding protein n=1 Tax=Actinomyces oricola TaxID=206043 RepID=UPI000FFE759D|nr:DNA-binding protein [Actinomyces oricola]